MRRATMSCGILLALCAQAGADPPEGFEVVDLIEVEVEDYLTPPALNNCGEIVFSVGVIDAPGAEIFMYDNGRIDQVTDNNVSDVFPDINDFGTIVWTRGYDGFLGGEIVKVESGAHPTVLAEGIGPRINNLERVVWNRLRPETCAFESDVFFFDGQETTQITSDNLSNQGAHLNELDDVAWTKSILCPDPWESDIMLHSEGVTIYLTEDQFQPVSPSINNSRQIVWQSDLGVELWEDGVTTVVTDEGATPVINNVGDIFFRRWDAQTNTMQPWLLREGTFYRLAEDTVYHFLGDINDTGEIAWYWSPDPFVLPWGISFLRRIRTGDADFDGDVDLSDFAALRGCLTGPVDTDRLCDCRFLDIDRDRDVDLTDVAIFQNAYTGP